jgi:hemolysin activation/secretion protein
MWFARLTYLVPVWHYGTRVGVTYSTFEYELAKEFADLGASGEGDVGSLFMFHPIIRTRNSNLIFQGAYEDKRLVDRVTATDSLEERAIDSFKAGLVGDFRDGLLGGGLNSYAVTLTRGELSLAPAALVAADQAATGRGTQGKFSKTNIDARRLQRVTETTNLLLALTYQEASKNLASAEKISLGGPNAVRAYPVGEATADTGAILQAELRIRPGLTWFGGDVIFSGHFDYGWAKINQDRLPSDTEAERTLMGIGIGLSIGNEGDFIIRGTMSDRVSDDLPQSDTASRHPRTWVQAIKWF